MPPLTLSLITILLSTTLSLARVKTICNKATYGQLDPTQCINLLHSFADAEDDRIRIFDEEQLFEGEGRSWAGVRNPFQTTVVQIPRVWTQYGCNIALMSYAGSFALDVLSNRTASHKELSRVGAMSWTQVVEVVGALLRDCSYERDVGGAAVVMSSLLPRRPVLTVFAWATGARFDDNFNSYMNDPHSFRPVDPGLMGGNGTAERSSS